MSCSSAIHTVNSTETSLSSGSTVPFGATIRRFGRHIEHAPDGIILSERGYYNIECSVTIRASEPGTIEVALCVDGDPLPGRSAKASVHEAGDYVTLPLCSLVRICEKDLKQTLSVRILCPGTVTSMSTVVMKV